MEGNQQRDKANSNNLGSISINIPKEEKSENKSKIKLNLKEKIVLL